MEKERKDQRELVSLNNIETMIRIVISCSRTTGFFCLAMGLIIGWLLSVNSK